MAETLLAVRDLRVSFAAPGREVAAVRGIDLDLHAHECLAVVGESGSGKSVTARALLGLAGPGATVRARQLSVAGTDLRGLTERQWRRVRGARIGLVSQDALTALDPLRTVGAEVAEALRNHERPSRPARAEKVLSLLTEVGLPEPALRAGQRPYELSGGQRQRALIASAIAAGPAVLVADEPTTALDVIGQAQLLELLAARRDAGTGLLLISHDLAVVARLADRIAVMYRGRIVEQGPAAALLAAPAHPYTRELLAAVPGTRPRGVRLSTRTGAAAAGGAACGYAPVCPLATDRCRTEEPPAAETGPGHTALCWRTAERLPAPPPLPVPRSAPVGEPVLEVCGLARSFGGRPAVREVSFTVGRGESLGVLGESGSGKSTVAAMVMGLLEPDAGTVTLLGTPWSGLPESRRRPLRDRLQLVHQDPLSAFDPRYSVQRIVGEALGATSPRAAARRREEITALLQRVGLDAGLLDRRPRQLSGGQRQRVALARALAPRPEVLVCDEPVSALDVSVQAQILDLFAEVRAELGLATVFISHDLGVIRHTCDRVIVLRAGTVVESGPVEDVFRAPAHPYTRELLAALPSPTASVRTEPTTTRS
ncbi:dipeptide ABC transporter ATP-binding protein [Streptomyces sp. NPDC020983]|uniref:dipeptide ABC transporter ATP-binding protein n=1 Tax=Streptomyces sp. NPDC020983 TaxID=3365106 RepID=UPI003791B30A